jgi:hypothetical protein
MPGTEDGPRSDRAGAVIDAALRRVPPTCGSGATDLAAAARPSGLPPERARHAAAPESDSSPTAFSRLVLVVLPVSVTHLPLDDFASPASDPATGHASGAPKACP